MVSSNLTLPDLVEQAFAACNAERHDEAEALCQRVLTIDPFNLDALHMLSVAQAANDKPDLALLSCERALALRPDFVFALYNRAAILRELKRYEEALRAYEAVLAVQPDHPNAFSGAAECALTLCDWDSQARLAGQMAARVQDATSIVAPFVLLGYSSDPSLQRRCAEKFVRDKVPTPLVPAFCRAGERSSARIRLAYLSADFHEHATAYLSAGLFEQHDRDRFEVIGVSFGHSRPGATRNRIVRAFDQFHDVRDLGDAEIADLLVELGVDIAIDLKGHTLDSRLGVLARRPAPIQVSYLGYPATMGADFIDYLIGDATVTPFAHQPFYAERIVHLPGSYQVNDSRRGRAAGTPTRVQAGLPDQGVVFCCFNGNWKITPAVFDVWMRLLRQVPASTLWLLKSNEVAERNLRREAEQRGVSPSRLVFGEVLPADRHLARYPLADMFLDTLPVNAHTTASDALWAGLPVLTCLGEAFAGRVAASLLQAAGMPDLIVNDLAAYEATALRLANDPAGLAGLKARLEASRDDCALFDTRRFARHIEAAYAAMWEARRGGEAPTSFAVKTSGP